MSYLTRNNAQEQRSTKQSSAKQSPAQFADLRATTAAQLKQQALMAASPSVTAQLKLKGQMTGAPVQRAAAEEELLQGKFATAQLAEDEELLQGKFAPAQRAEDEELLQGKFATAQLAEDEELLQGKFETAQRAEDEELLQGKFEPAQRETKPNNTGLPDNLKSGIESLSGMSMDNVKVHYNSDKPSQLNAHAYAQGSDIHVAPGQEQHLPHEAWHVVQQAQGRVKPTMQMKAGVPVNDDVGLETEADVMGAKALQLAPVGVSGNSSLPTTNIIQRIGDVNAKQQLRTGAYAANFTMAFLNKHIGFNANNNVSCTHIHANRPTNVPINTVIMDAQDLKAKLAAGAWVSDNNGGWGITTAGTVALQDTRRRNANIAAEPAKPLAVVPGTQAEAFTVEDGKITAITGVSALELTTAIANVGAYPRNGSSHKKRDYRNKLVTNIKSQRQTAYNDSELTWMRDNFNRIGATAINQVTTTRDDIVGIATRQEQVRVNMDSSGDICHFDGYP